MGALSACRRLRELRFASGLSGWHSAYASVVKTHDCVEKQLELWNAEWTRILKASPHYGAIAAERKLPASFKSWEQFFDALPVTNRAVLRECWPGMSCGHGEFSRITGGSTSQPLQIPAWTSELETTRLDLWGARSRYGIRPSSRLFLIWGHSHLLGRGLYGKLNGARRRLSDLALGYYRFPAYDLQPAAMRKAREALVRFRPEYVLGYSVALDAFARENRNYADEIRNLGIKLVIGAAEAFPSPDSRRQLESLFGCPVAMEYGSVETNLMAHTHPEGGYRVFWRSYFMEVDPPGPGGRGQTVRVTSLYPRCVPLVRYELGDEIALPGESTAGVTRFEEVLGRCNDYVELEDGARIHSEAFTHAVRACPEIKGFQVVQNGFHVVVQTLSETQLSDSSLSDIRHKLALIHHGLAQTQIKPVTELYRTIAGKTPMIIKQ